MNPVFVPIVITRGSLYQANFDFTDALGAPVPMTGYTPVMMVLRGTDVVMTSLVQVVGVAPVLELTPEPGAVVGRLGLRIGSDVTGGLLMPVDQSELGLHYRVDLIHDTLAGVDLAMRYGSFDLGDDR